MTVEITNKHTQSILKMLTMQTISCSQRGLTFNHELDTSRFNRNIFKICTECGSFVHDFAEIFCGGCCQKLQYVDVTDLTTLKNWLLFFESQQYQNNDQNDDKDSITPNNSVVLMSEVHNCDNSDDCIDCMDRLTDRESDFGDIECDASDATECDASVCYWDMDSVG